MSNTAAARPVLSKTKSITLGALGLVVIVIIFVRVIPQIGSYHDALTSLKAMTAGALVCIVVSVLVYLAAYGLPFMTATPGLRYWRSQQLNQSAFAISNGVPAGGAFGLGVQYAMLASYGIEPTASTAAITAVGVWSIFVTLGLPILGVVAIQLSGQAATSYVWPGVLGLVVLAVAIVGFALIVRSESAARHIGSAGDRIVAPFARRFAKGRTVDLVPAALVGAHRCAAVGVGHPVPDLLRDASRGRGLGFRRDVAACGVRLVRSGPDRSDDPDHTRRPRHGGRNNDRAPDRARCRLRCRDCGRPGVARCFVRPADHHRSHHAHNLEPQGRPGTGRTRGCPQRADR